MDMPNHNDFRHGKDARLILHHDLARGERYRDAKRV